MPGRPGSRRTPVMIEALAYLGGAVVLVGAMLIGAQYWAALGTGTRLLIVAATALVLLAAGSAVPASSGTAPGRLVIGLDRTGRPEELLTAGADVVVRDLDEIAVPTGQMSVR
jgi:hypothetical protein